MSFRTIEQQIFGNSDPVIAVLMRLLPLEWRDSAYYRGDIRCCNDRYMYTCTLLPDHEGPHCATDATGAPMWETQSGSV